MKIQWTKTRGCFYPSISIDNKDLSEIDAETRKLALEKIKKYVLSNGIPEDYILEGLLSHLYDNEAFRSKYKLTENESTWELFVNGKKIKDLLKSGKWKEIINDIPDTDPVFLWFMENYIDIELLTYECQSSVHSKTINI